MCECYTQLVVALPLSLPLSNYLPLSLSLSLSVSLYISLASLSLSLVTQCNGDEECLFVIYGPSMSSEGI